MQLLPQLPLPPPPLQQQQQVAARRCRPFSAPAASRRRSIGQGQLGRRRRAAGAVCADSKFALGSSALPLADKRILVTGPRQYAGKLATKLLEAGARPMWLPTIAITELHGAQEREALLRALRDDLPRCDHLLFSSKNGVAAALGALQGWLGSLEAAVEHIQRSGAKCWALGADAEVLLEAGVRGVHRPQEPSTQGLVQELMRRGEAKGRRALCPVPLVAPPLVEPEVVPRFLAGLQQAGVEALRVDAYETRVGCMPASCAAEWELLMEGEIHAIAFSSTAEAQGLVHLMGGVGFVHQAVRAHDVLLAAHGPYTAGGVANVLGVPVTCVSQDSSTFDGLVTALGNAIGRATSPRQRWMMAEGAERLERAQRGQGGRPEPSYDGTWREDAPPGARA